MTDFIVKSLQLIPEPAALYEFPSLRFIEGNAACYDIGKTTFDAASRLDLWEALISGDVAATGPAFDVWGINLVKVRRAITIDPGHYAKETPHGVVFMSRLLTRPGLTRPDVLLTTVHQASRENAYMQHLRMISVLNINEETARSLSLLETAQATIEAAVSAQRHMLEQSNRIAESFFHLQANIPYERA